MKELIFNGEYLGHSGTITIDKDIKYLGNEAFFECDLKILDLKSASVEYMNIHSIYQCEIETLYLPENLKIFEITEWGNANNDIEDIWISVNTQVVSRHINNLSNVCDTIHYYPVEQTSISQVKAPVTTKRRR